MADARRTPMPTPTPNGPRDPGGDARFVAALREGSEEAFEELVRTHRGRMLAVARRLLGDSEDAHDAVQEAFLSAFRSIDSFAGQARLPTWLLHRIVVNAALMRLRTRRRKPEHPIDDRLLAFEADGHRRDPGGPWQPAARLTLSANRARKAAGAAEGERS